MADILAGSYPPWGGGINKLFSPKTEKQGKNKVNQWPKIPKIPLFGVIFGHCLKVCKLLLFFAKFYFYESIFMYLTTLNPIESYKVNFRPRNTAKNRAKIRFLKFSSWGINKQNWPEYSPLDPPHTYLGGGYNQNPYLGVIWGGFVWGDHSEVGGPSTFVSPGQSNTSKVIPFIFIT